MNRKRKDNGIAIDVALLVLVLGVFSSLFVSGFLAKYRSGETGSESARIAKWGTELTAGPRIEVLPGGNTAVTYPIVVTNSSEEAISYDISIVFTQNMADKIEDPRLNGASPTEGASFTTILSFASAGTLPASNGVTPQTETLNLTFTVSDSYLATLIGTGVDYDNEIISGSVVTIPFTVNAVIKQID